MRTSLQFTEWLLIQNRTPATVRCYQSDLRMFGQWFRKTRNAPFTTPEQLQTAVVREYKRYMLTEAGRKENTINRRLATLGTYARWGQAMGLLDHNPAEAVSTVTIPEQTTRWLDIREQTAIIQAVTDLPQSVTPRTQFLSARNRAIVLTILNSGLQVGEVCELKTNNLRISGENERIWVQPKDSNNKRSILLNSQATEALNAWLTVRQEWLDKLGLHEPYVFISQIGSPIQSRNIQKLITKLGNRIGIKLTCRVLRHTFAKNQIKAGVSIEEVAAVLGYKNVSSARIYVCSSTNKISKKE
jgi:integrase/recombinase XerC